MRRKKLQHHKKHLPPIVPDASALVTHAPKTSLPPGTPVHTGQQSTAPIKISLFDFDPENFIELDIRDVEECYPFRDKPSITWINVDGIHKVEVIEGLGKNFGLHQLVIEDIVNTDQRPKFEDYGDYLYIVLKMLHHRSDSEILAEQVSLIIGSNFVLSFQESVEGDVFNPIRERIRTGKGRVRKRGADYLAYVMVDMIVDYYFSVLEKIGEEIEVVEDEISSNPSPPTLNHIHSLKWSVTFLRRSIWPTREVITAFGNNESGLVQPSTKVFIRDAYDHCLRVIDSVETYREMVSGLLDIYLSSTSNRLNEIIKVLTIITTVFMPLTFLTGLYGMNFQYMPGLHDSNGFEIMIGIMVVVLGSMLLYFKHRRWI